MLYPFAFNVTFPNPQIVRCRTDGGCCPERHAEPRDACCAQLACSCQACPVSRFLLLCCSHLHAGIAYDRQRKRIFITGKNWSKLYEIEVMLQQDKPGKKQNLEDTRMLCIK